MEATIRKTTEKDFEAVANLLKHPNIAGNLSKKQFVGMLEKNKGFCFVAEASGKVVGTVFGIHDGASIGYAHKLVVDEAHRRQKVATRLLQRLLKRFEKAGIPLVFTHTGKTNEASIRLLKSLGFEIRDTYYLMDKGYKPKTER